MKSFPTAAPTTAGSPRKGESSTKIVRYDLPIQPAFAVRGSSRRIMSMRFRPAYISVINRRANSPAVIGAAVGKDNSRLTSGNVFPLRRPSGSARMPQRSSRSRVRSAAPDNGAPWTAPRRSGPTYFAMGGSGGNTGAFSDYSERKTYLKPTTQNSTGLDKVAPYQFSVGILSTLSTITFSTGT